jgi:hypothetical protein
MLGGPPEWAIELSGISSVGLCFLDWHKENEIEQVEL